MCIRDRPYIVPSDPTSLYLTPSVHSTNLEDIPSNPHKIIQKVAPGPPIAIAIATPAMFPLPTVPDTAVAKAWKWLTSPLSFLFSSSPSYLPITVLKESPNPRILINPKYRVKKAAPPTNKKIDRFKLISPEGKEITSTSSNLTKKIINTWGVRENNNQKLLKVSNITKVFDDSSLSSSKKINDERVVKAVNEVSFELFEGETLGLVGESGSGKSTIAKIITGLVRPTVGEIEYNNLSLYDKRKKYQIHKSRGQIQMIFQDPYSSLNPRFKVCLLYTSDAADE